MEPGRNDSCDDRDGLKPLVAALLGKVDSLLAQNATLLDEIKRLNARIAELEARDRQPPKTPDNSSRPPSTGQKSNIAPASAKKRRKGRAGVARALC
jgi:transposase